MQNRWAIVGGVMSIVAGALGALGGLALVLFAVLFSSLLSWVANTSDAFGPAERGLTGLVGLMYGSMGAFLLLVGILALIGGICAVRRRLWGLALAGSIATILAFFPVGIVAVVFTAMARPEFSANGATPAVSPPPPGTV